MGIFAEWQPRYAHEGIATFPTIDKRPCVKGWQRIGPKGSAQLAFKFPEANEIAFLAGKRTGLTIIDVDTTDEDLWRDARKRFGETPIMVRTGSGHLQLWYRHNDEPRKVRADECIDVLGSGQVLGFPSARGKGYHAIRGTLADIHRLPIARNVEMATLATAARCGTIQPGNRNRALFDHLMREVRHVDQFDDLLDVARTFADTEFAAPLTDAELVRTAQSAWGYEAKGLNRYGAAATLNIHRDAVLTHAASNPDAFALFCILQTEHKGLRDTFIISKPMAERLGWHLRKFKAARDYLIKAGLLTCVHPGGRGPRDPARYRF